VVLSKNNQTGMIKLMYSETQKEQGSISIILAVVFGLFFIGASVFGVWAFSERQDFKNNVEQKVDTAVVVAVKNAQSAKDAEFVEQEKLPTRLFTGSATYGSLSFEYPKTWSVYAQENTSGTVLDVYAHPRIVPGLQSKQPYALRVEILSAQYDTQAESLLRLVERGEITAKALRPAKLASVLGLRVDGEISQSTTGAAIYLPLRDRTIRISTESSEFLKDFNDIIAPSITFVP
jgi:hypothetical protein